MKKIFFSFLFIGVLGGLVFLGGCIFDRDQKNSAPEEKEASADANTLEPQTGDVSATIKVADEATEEKVSVPLAEVKEFRINVRQWEFSPATISVKKGDSVKLTITSFDIPHGFALPEYNIDEFLSPGVTKTVEFIADKVGSFGFFCNVSCGSGHANMKGLLVVSE